MDISELIKVMEEAGVPVITLGFEDETEEELKEKLKQLDYLFNPEGK